MDRCMGWLWVTDGGSDVERQQKPRRRRVRSVRCCALLGVLSLVQLFAWVSVLSPKHTGFRASSPVETEDQAKLLMQAVYPFLHELHLKYPKACAFAGANVHVYDQILVAKEPGGQLSTLFNPEVFPVQDSAVSELRETSYLCTDLTVSRLAQRYDEVVCRYRDENFVLQRKSVKGAQAVCLQHFVEVLQGTWPCNSTKNEL